jgi:nicotinate phosphoribosyltransferase
LDVDSILGLHAYFAGTLRNAARPADFRHAADFLDSNKWQPRRRIRFSAGWGTLLTNDFRDCNPRGDNSFDPLSLVCKLNEADGRPAVKLSDNFQKALGSPTDIERYRRVFGMAGVTDIPVTV